MFYSFQVSCQLLNRTIIIYLSGHCESVSSDGVPSRRRSNDITHKVYYRFIGLLGIGWSIENEMEVISFQTGYSIGGSDSLLHRRGRPCHSIHSRSRIHPSVRILSLIVIYVVDFELHENCMALVILGDNLKCNEPIRSVISSRIIFFSTRKDISNCLISDYVQDLRRWLSFFLSISLLNNWYCDFLHLALVGKILRVNKIVCRFIVQSTIVIGPHNYLLISLINHSRVEGKLKHGRNREGHSYVLCAYSHIANLICVKLEFDVRSNTWKWFEYWSNIETRTWLVNIFWKYFFKKKLWSCIH